MAKNKKLLKVKGKSKTKISGGKTKAIKEKSPAKKITKKNQHKSSKSSFSKAAKSRPKKILKTVKRSKVVKPKGIKKTQTKKIEKKLLKKAPLKAAKKILPKKDTLLKTSSKKSEPVKNDNKKDRNIVPLKGTLSFVEKKGVDLSGEDERMPVFALRGSSLNVEKNKQVPFKIPSFPQARITERESEKSVAKNKNPKQVSQPKSNSGKKMTAQVKVNVKYDKSGKVILPEGYKPSENEKYMNPLQVEYFRRKLEMWKKELLSESNETIEHLMAESWNEPDPSDQATIVEQTGLELRTRDRYRKLINKIDAALRRVEEGEYGFCEVTGDPIGLKRLEARPIATMTIAAQEQHELEEKLSLED